MVVTFGTFLCGYLAIMGIPPFDGFYSKDKIIEAAFGANIWVGLVTFIGAMLTGFYMTRIFVMTFLGKARWDDDAHPHESPKSMIVPMAILALLSTVGGFTLPAAPKVARTVLGHRIRPAAPARCVSMVLAWCCRGVPDG
jgi:NADH-quinone oxidoreductase subunit L